MSKRVEIQYNPYSQTSKVILNGHSVSITSRIANYMTEPIEHWGTEILDCIASEMNDCYDLMFISNPIECSLMEYWASQHPKCTSFEMKNFSVALPASLRCKTLSATFGSTCPDLFRVNSIQVNVYGMDAERLSAGARANFSEMPEGLTVSVNSSDSFPSPDELNQTANSIIIVSSDAELSKMVSAYSKTTKNVFIVHNSSESLHPILCTKQGNAYGFSCDLDTYHYVSNDFITYLVEYAFLSGSVHDAVDNALKNIALNSLTLTDEMKVALCKAQIVEPVALDVSLPDVIETERFATASVTYYPDNVSPPEVEFRLSREGYLKCVGDTFYGMNDGEVDVEVYEKGSIKHFFRKRIRVLHVIRATSISLDYGYTLVGSGDEFSIPYSYLPEDAQNIKRIKWTSSNPEVATVDKEGKIHAHSRGATVITADIEGVNSSCNVEVKPYVSRIELSANELIVNYNENSPLKVKTYPDDCIDENELTVTYSDSNIAEFIASEGRVRPKGRGDSVLTFYMPKHKNIKANCVVTVKSKYDEDDRGHLFTILAIISFILGLFIGPFLSIVSVILSIISFKRDKSGWEGLNTIMIIVNIIRFIAAMVML